MTYQKTDPYQHVYVGETTHDGLARDAAIRILGKRAGGCLVMDKHGDRYLVGKQQVKKK